MTSRYFAFRVSLILILLVSFSVRAFADQEDEAAIIETCLKNIDSTGLKILIGMSNHAVDPTELSESYSDLGIESIVSVLKELFEKNKVSLALSTPRLQDTISISEALRDQLFSTRGWDGIREHFPTARVIVTTSRPVVFQDGKKAVLYLTESSGLTSGRGTFQILEKRGESWAVTEIVEVFIS